MFRLKGWTNNDLHLVDTKFCSYSVGSNSTGKIRVRRTTEVPKLVYRVLTRVLVITNLHGNEVSGSKLKCHSLQVVHQTKCQDNWCNVGRNQESLIGELAYWIMSKSTMWWNREKKSSTVENWEWRERIMSRVSFRCSYLQMSNWEYLQLIWQPSWDCFNRQPNWINYCTSVQRIEISCIGIYDSLNEDRKYMGTCLLQREIPFVTNHLLASHIKDQTICY
jgi:hypothetical protein